MSEEKRRVRVMVMNHIAIEGGHVIIEKSKSYEKAEFKMPSTYIDTGTL